MTAATGVPARVPTAAATLPRASFLRGPFSRSAWRDTAFTAAAGG